MEKLIHTRMGGTCKRCGQRIAPNTRVLWYGHNQGIAHHPSCQPDKPKRPAPTPKQTDEMTFQLEWGNVKNAYVAAVNRVKSAREILTRRSNQNELADHVTSWNIGGSFYHVTSEQVVAWITSGFHVPGIENANPDLVPVRKRRKLKFDEDGELQLDMVYSGFDYPYLEWEKRERKPGMRLEIGVSFNSNTSGAVIAEYQKWVAQAITTLEQSGYDLEINLTNSVRDVLVHRSGTVKTMVRVKRENEASDFTEWSALFSPGGFRHLMFMAKMMGADENGYDILGHFGYPLGVTEWDISFDAETRTMSIQAPIEPASFSEAAMTEKFLALIAGDSH